ncbi:hypothetical protein Vretimale_3007 [Volvox reticuliferus]|uniref:Uncharacterized protein n=1 Tax=Volvox reticuliferus TaxID=1737510 RepID=A0A8J4DCK4_9CHLO|nr:hypothetical protein Vretimale_3007 [Volvox reticuliferus]
MYLYIIICLASAMAIPQNDGMAGSGGAGGPGQGGPGQGGPGQGGPVHDQDQGPANTDGINNGTTRPISTQGGNEGDGKPNNGSAWGGNPNKPPRGDDPRPRSWGARNTRNETEFDDRKSPRKVSFLGESANVRIYPNYSDTSIFLQLRFGQIVELDGGGQPVPMHRIASLADAGHGVTFNATNRTVGNVNASSVSVTVRPAEREEFRPVCSGGIGASLPPAPPAPPANLAPSVSVELLFGLDDVLTLPYGATNVTVPRNGLKWTVSFANWPFCNDTNALQITLGLLLPANATAVVDTSGNLTTLTLRLGTDYNASLSFLNYALDGPSGSIKLPANVTVMKKSDDGSVAVNIVLPNPKPRGAAGVWYDPTSTTTSVYLSSSDPGNGYIPVANGGGNNTTTGGAAAGLRVTFWAALAAIMLTAFLLN